MTWTRRSAVAAAVAAAIGLGALLLGTTGAATSRRARAVGAHGGAAAAATAWCQTTAEAFVNGGWDSAVAALAVGSFRAQGLRYGPAAAMVHRRLTGARTPYAFRVWPLGYRVLQSSATAARVRVWQLFVLVIASPEALTQFTTTTVSLEWTRGAWKVIAAAPGADLAPPGSGATAGAVGTWVAAVDRLEAYRYVP